jgi:hypothetical protein
MNDRKLDEAMDACRANSNDLQLPEMQPLARALQEDAELGEVFRQRQQCDQQIGDGLRQVELEPRRRERLLAASQAVADAYAQAQAVRPASRPQVVRRRRLVLAALGLTAISLLLLVRLAVDWLNPWTAVGPQQLAYWTLQDWRPNPRAWRSMAALPPARRQAISHFLRKYPSRWQPLATHLDPDALIFDLSGRKQPIRLFVLQAAYRAKRLPTRPPQQPQTAREGQLFAAWQEATNVYVLSVAGPPQRYRDVVNTRGDSLARAGRDATAH